MQCLCSGGVQELGEPLNGVLRVRLELVIVINKKETKPRSITSSPLPIIQQRPYKIPFYIASIFSGFDQLEPTLAFGPQDVFMKINRNLNSYT